jgi:hypothetical protein
LRGVGVLCVIDGEDVAGDVGWGGWSRQGEDGLNRLRAILKANGPSRSRWPAAGKGRSNAPGGGRLLSVGPDPVLVERKLVSGELTCPDCGHRLAPWGHASPRFVRVAAELARRIRPRRAICSGAVGCGRSHVLLPRLCLGRRVDAVAVIWTALLARAMGQGWRAITEAVGRPASTVRGWLSRFAAHAGGDLDRLAPTGSDVGDAVAQIGAACAAVRRMWGTAVLAVSAAEMVAACSGGWLLAARAVRPGGLWINTSPHL